MYIYNWQITIIKKYIEILQKEARKKYENFSEEKKNNEKRSKIFLKKKKKKSVGAADNLFEELKQKHWEIQWEKHWILEKLFFNT